MSGLIFCPQRQGMRMKSERVSGSVCVCMYEFCWGNLSSRKVFSTNESWQVVAQRGPASVCRPGLMSLVCFESLNALSYSDRTSSHLGWQHVLIIHHHLRVPTCGSPCLSLSPPCLFPLEIAYRSSVCVVCQLWVA